MEAAAVGLVAFPFEELKGLPFIEALPPFRVQQSDRVGRAPKRLWWQILPPLQYPVRAPFQQPRDARSGASRP